jgi:chromosomal replication initiation ATPase DnaA
MKLTTKYEITKELEIVRQVVCKDYGIDVDAIYIRTRKQEIVRSRQMIWAICKQIFKDKYNLAYYGTALGCKLDHASVFYGIDEVKSQREVNKDFDYRYNKLLNMCLTNLNEKHENITVQDADLRLIYLDICKIKEKMEDVLG